MRFINYGMHTDGLGKHVACFAAAVAISGDKSKDISQSKLRWSELVLQ